MSFIGTDHIVSDSPKTIFGSVSADDSDLSKPVEAGKPIFVVSNMVLLFPESMGRTSFQRCTHERVQKIVSECECACHIERFICKPNGDANELR